MSSYDKQWTDSQLKAIRTVKGSVCVSAGAGAGKTGALVERFLHLVKDHNVPADKIICITFTKKAVKEMKERIIKALTDAGLHEQRRLVESAYIHTIHSFCSRILSENPFESGIDPQFTTINENAAKPFMNQAFLSVIEIHLQSDTSIRTMIATSPAIPVYNGNRDNLLEPLEKSVNQLLNKIRSYGLTQLELSSWINDLSADGIQGLHKILDEKRTNFIDEMNQVVSNTTSPSLKIQLSKCLSSAQNHSDWFEYVKQTLPGIIQNTSTKKHPVLLEISKFLKELDIKKEELMYQNSLALLIITSDYWEELERLKTINNVLDQNNLLEKAKQLFDDNPSVLQRLKSRFVHCMVDEFQDVNGLMFDIVKRINIGDSLLIVGDERQSIYAFNHANVDIFRIEQKNTFDKSITDPDNYSGINLNHNFRSRIEILDFLQAFFGKLWNDDNYNALQPGRKHEPLDEPAVEIWKTDGGDWDEPMLMAKEIKEMVESQRCIIFDPSQKCDRPAEYKDIVILLRQFTRIAQYEKAFTDVGVPYFVSGSNHGYFQRNEVRDIHNALLALQEPEDSHSIACVLRSPLVGISLDALTLAVNASNKSNKPLIAQLRNLPDGIDELDIEKINQFLIWFDELHPIAEKCRVAELLDALVSRTCLDAKLLCRPGGAQSLANVKKLIQMALSTSGVTLTGFINRINLLENVQIREGNAPTNDEVSDVVRFMTVHSAKGLEFPVVIHANLTTKKMNFTEMFKVDINNRIIGLNWRGYSSFIYNELKVEQDKKSDEEINRLLYVAMTRAQERLIFVAPLTFGPRMKDSWAELIAKTINIGSSMKDESIETLSNGTKVFVKRLKLATKSASTINA